MLNDLERGPTTVFCLRVMLSTCTHSYLLIGVIFLCSKKFVADRVSTECTEVVFLLFSVPACHSLLVSVIFCFFSNYTADCSAQF